MNYYEHHLGDYIKDTAHLSILEDGVYRRLIDAYYNSEAPLSSDLKECFKLVRAKNKKEIEAVEYILEKFFDLEDDGFHHKRCDEEIAKYHAKQPAAEAKKESDRERQNRARQRRKELFTALLAHGITAPWNSKTHELEEMLSRTSHKPVTRDNTATSNQTPVTSNQSIKEPSSKIVTDIKPDEPDIKTLKTITAPALTALGIKTSSASLVMQGWIRDKFTVQQITAAIAKAREHKPWPEIIPENYLDKVIREPVPWFTNETTIKAEMVRLGLTIRTGETWGNIKERIKAERKKRNE
jgi:uncharacterized protein YdaU (DUF1376 family)